MFALWVWEGERIWTRDLIVPALCLAVAPWNIFEERIRFNFVIFFSRDLMTYFFQKLVFLNFDQRTRLLKHHMTTTLFFRSWNIFWKIEWFSYGKRHFESLVTHITWKAKFVGIVKTLCQVLWSTPRILNEEVKDINTDVYRMDGE